MMKELIIMIHVEIRVALPCDGLLPIWHFAHHFRMFSCRMMSSNAKASVFALNNFDPRADSGVLVLSRVACPHIFLNTFLEKVDTFDNYKDPDPASQCGVVLITYEYLSCVGAINYVSDL